MNDLIGDPDLDLLILPIVVTTLVFGQAIEECVNWFRRHVRLPYRSVATET